MQVRFLRRSFPSRRIFFRRQFCAQVPKDTPPQETEAEPLENTSVDTTLTKQNSVDRHAAQVYPNSIPLLYGRLMRSVFKGLLTQGTDQLIAFKAAWAVFKSKEGDVKKTIETIVFGAYDEVCERAKTELKEELSKDAREVYETKKLEIEQEADRVCELTKESLGDFVTKKEETFKTKIDSYASEKESEFKDNVRNESIAEFNQFKENVQRTTEIKKDEIKNLLISLVSKSNSDLENKAIELFDKIKLIASESHSSFYKETQEKYNQYFIDKDRLYEHFFESNREIFEAFFKRNFEDFESFAEENRKKTLNEILVDYVDRRTDFENYLIGRKEKFDTYFDEISRSQKNNFESVTSSITSLHSEAEKSLNNISKEAEGSLETKGKVLKKQVGRNALIANIGWFIVLNIIVVLCILLLDYGVYKFYIESILEDSLDALILFEDFEKRIDSSYIDYLTKNNDFSNAIPLKALSFLMTYKFFAALFLRSKSEGGVQLCIGSLGVLCSDYEVALRAFDQVLESKDSNVKQIHQASYGKAYIFLKQEKFQSALKVINNTVDALNKNKNLDNKLRVRCLILQSNILYQLKNHNEAIQLLDVLLKEKDCPLEDAYKVIIYKKLGDYYYSDGKYQEAKKSYNTSKELNQHLEISNKKPAILSRFVQKLGKRSQLSPFEMDYKTAMVYELEASLLAAQFHLVEESHLLDSRQKDDEKEILKKRLYDLNENLGHFNKNIASKLLVLNDLFRINLFRKRLGITTDYEYAVLNREIFNDTYKELKEFGWEIVKSPALDLNGKIQYFLLHHSVRKEYLYIFKADASYDETIKSLLQNRAGGEIVSPVINDIQSRNKNGIKITFTGYAFGALYAEYINWKICENPDVYPDSKFECITFNSPGSAAVIKELISRNTSNVSQDICDNFTRTTRIYLPSPDKINTTNQQAVKPIHVFTPFKYPTRGLNWVGDCFLGVVYYLSGKLDYLLGNWLRSGLMWAFPDSRRGEGFTLDQIINAAFDEETRKVKQVGNHSPALIKRWPRGTADFIEYLDLENKVPSEISLMDARIDFSPDQQNTLDRIYCSESTRYKYNVSSLQELSPEIRSYLRAYVKTNGAIDRGADSVLLQFSIQNNQIELHSGISISEFKRYIQSRIGQIGEDKLRGYKTSLFQTQYFTEHYGMLLSRTNPGRDNEDIHDFSTTTSIRLEKCNG